MAALKPIGVIMITLMLFGSVSAVNHAVGGPSGWSLTPDIQRWAAETEFSVGDFLVFMYKTVYDVLEVRLSDYSNCNAAHPIRSYNDGKTLIQLTKPGPKYFICGRLDHCKRGLKLQVKVLPLLSYDNNNGTATPTNISSSSSPATQGRHKP